MILTGQLQIRLTIMQGICRPLIHTTVTTDTSSRHIMFYGLQHFNVIENSYRIESEKQVREQLREENRQLRLTEAQLSQPGRIDGMARQLGMTEPQPGQVVHATTHIDNGAPVLAQVNAPQAPPAN